MVVAGTNGKGSSVAALEQLLTDAGQRVGVYTSPHFQHYNERFRINCVEVNDGDICTALHTIERARGDVKLTYFEFSTLVALQLFANAELDVAILEVGLGGRLDAVNMVRADIALITRIDLDHQDWLGDTREQIGAEKAGILRDGIAFVCADIDPPKTVVKAAALKQTRRCFIGNEFVVSPFADGNGYSLRTQAGVDHRLPAIGLHPASLAAAVQSVELLGLDMSPDCVAASLAKVSLPGRQQQLRLGDGLVFLDVAHNPSAVSYLKESIAAADRSHQASATIAVFAVMADKDWPEMVDIIHDTIDHWFLAELPGNERAEAPHNIAAYLRERGYGGSTCTDDVGTALDLARATAQQSSADTPAQILVFGSFYTVAAAMHYIADRQNG